MLAENQARRRFTVPEVLRMVETGVLREDEPVELIEGELIVVPPQGFDHGNRVTAITMLLVPLYAGTAMVRVQLLLDVDLESLPEPDFLIARETPGRHPRGSDALLAIEVTKTSHAMDRAKARLYARAGIPVYWLIDLVAHRIEERAQPDVDGEYRITKLYTPRDEIELPGLAERIRVANLLGVEA